MRRALLGLTLAVAALAVPSAAQAAFPTNVFNGAVGCAVQNAPAAVAGQRWCTGSPSKAASFDGAPIDVAFYAPPAPAQGADGTFPVIGVFHGYNGVKYPPTSTDVQRWVTNGYAVFTMTDRGFRDSCGPAGFQANPAACQKGYVHLLSNQWEVRDAQFLLGRLADDGAIAPKRIGAVGQSYGSGMSAQLGALKNRVQQGALTGETNGTLVPWKSSNGTDMEIAATAPEFGWSDLAYSLVPNGSTLDYAALNPYRGPAGQTRRTGVAKASWTESLFFSPLSSNPPTGYYCGLINPPCNDARYDLPAFRIAVSGTNQTNGTLAPDVATPSQPFDNNATINNALDELTNFHGSYGTDDSIAPAPALLSNGWNDDLFPVDEAVRYYNKVRQKYPDAPINLWAFDWGHPTRTAINIDNVTSLYAAETRWMNFYVRNIGTAPEDAAGGVNTINSACSDETSGAGPLPGTITHSKNWASLSKGELTVSSAADQAITATATATAAFQPFPTSPSNVTICTTSADTNVTGLALYTVPAQQADYTIAGSPTVKVDLTTGNVNDALLARLYDVNTTNNTRRLIARSALRPYGTVPGTGTQVFQLHPQQWKVVAGHTLKLELLAQDAPYIRRTANQANMSVKNLELRVPTLDAPAGNIKAPAAKDVPAGYTLARDFATPTPTASSTPTATPTYTIPTATPTAYPTIPPGTNKVTPGLTVKAKPKKDTKKPFKFTVSGKLNPKSAGKAAGCKGTVKITTNKGGKASAKVKSNCTYKAKVKLAKKAGKKGTAKITARFGGNSVLKAKSAKTSVKYGKKGKKK